MTIHPTDIGPDENIEGYLIGSPVSLIREFTAVPGAGPRLHRHPYVETFLVHSGRALFTLGDEQVVVEGGQVIAAPALVVHRFEVLDGGTYNATHIHANDRFVTEWLE